MDSRQNNPAPLVQGLPLRFQANFWIHNSQARQQVVPGFQNGDHRPALVVAA
jgi:hypothetical protein